MLQKEATIGSNRARKIENVLAREIGRDTVRSSCAARMVVWPSSKWMRYLLHDRATASKALDWLPEQEVRTVASNREERPRPLWKWGAAPGIAPRK
jgi:hypothetical protein